MMKGLVLVCLCIYVSFAQTPTRPTMMETFTATGEVEVHEADMTGFGKFMMARNQATEMGLEKELYNGPGRDEISEALYRYDQNVTYYIRGDADHPHCLVEERKFTGMPEYWVWLQYANYEGVDRVREVDYDLWAINIGGVRYEFGKPQSNSSILYTYRRKSAEYSVFYSIMEYSTAAPGADVFAVPDECKQRKKN